MKSQKEKTCRICCEEVAENTLTGVDYPICDLCWSLQRECVEHMDLEDHINFALNIDSERN